MVTAQSADLATPAPPSSASPPRLVLAPVRANRAVLDGGWWPRSWDPGAELPGLVGALSVRYGKIRQLMLNSTTWDERFRLLTVGDDVVRMGWFTSVDPAALVATTAEGMQVDLLVVPPQASAEAAEKAMTEAANPENRLRAPAILAARPTAPATDPAEGAGDQPVWDNEGGRIRGRPWPGNQLFPSA